MKTEIEQLVACLADKSLKFGCRVTLKNYNQIEETHDLFFVGDAVDKEGNDAFMIMAKSYSEKPLYQVWDKYDIEPLGNDIMIGDILELMEKKKWGAGVRDLINIPNSATIIDLWAQCRTPSDIENRRTGLTKSLQEIIASTEWEEAECDEPHCKNGHYPLGITEDGEVDWGACPKCKPLEGKALFPKSPAVERLVGNLLSLDL